MAWMIFRACSCNLPLTYSDIILCFRIGRKDVFEEGAGNRVSLVQLALKVTREASSPSTGEERGEGA